MDINYRICEGVYTDEQGRRYSAFGIEAVRSTGEIGESFPDIFFDEVQARQLVELCNRERVEPVHLFDIVTDAITAQCEVTRFHHQGCR